MYGVSLDDLYAEVRSCMEDIVLTSYSAVINSSTAACDYRETTSTQVIEDAWKAFVASITDESVKDVSQLTRRDLEKQKRWKDTTRHARAIVLLRNQPINQFEPSYVTPAPLLSTVHTSK